MESRVRTQALGDRPLDITIKKTQRATGLGRWRKDILEDDYNPISLKKQNPQNLEVTDFSPLGKLVYLHQGDYINLSSLWPFQKYANR